MNNGRTISTYLSFYQTLTTANQPIEEIHSLLSLNDGVNGYPHVSHGGVVTITLDEVMGLLLHPNKDREAKVSRKEERVPLIVSIVTAEWDVRYMNLILTPQTVWAILKFSKIDGRRIWLEGIVKDGPDSMLTTGRSLFLQIN